MLGRRAMNQIYELGFYIASFSVTGMLIRWLWPENKGLTWSEMRPFLIPLGWGSLIAVAFILSGLWKPLEYVVTVPSVVLLVVLLRRWAKRVR